MDETRLEDEALRLVLRKPNWQTTTTATSGSERSIEPDGKSASRSLLRSPEQGGDEEDPSQYYAPPKIATSSGTSFDVRCGHVGLSALMAAARIVMPWTNKSYRGLLEVWACEKTEDDARKQKDIQDRIFQKNNEYAAAREQRRAAVRAKEMEKASLDAPFSPKISDYAKQSSAPKTVNEFFPRGVEWKQRKEKKLAALRAKERQEAEEEEAEDLAAHRWKLSAASARILQHAKQRRDTEDTSLTDQAAEASSSLSLLSPSDRLTRRTAATPSPSAARQKAAMGNEAHHTPILSNRSRELTKDLPPFDYRLRISCERKQNILRQHAHAQAIRVDIPEGIEEVRKGPFRSDDDIADIVDRLHFAEKTHVEDPNTTFHPQITPRAQRTSPRVMTPTRQQLVAASEGRQRRQAAHLRLQALETAPSSPQSFPTSQTPSPSRNKTTRIAQDDFLFRADVWSRQRDDKQRLLRAAAAQDFDRHHSFHPLTSPTSSAMVLAQQRHRDVVAMSTKAEEHAAGVHSEAVAAGLRGDSRQQEQQRHRFLTLDDHLDETIGHHEQRADSSSHTVVSGQRQLRYEGQGSSRHSGQGGGGSLTASSITTVGTLDEEVLDDDDDDDDDDVKHVRRPLEDLAEASESNVDVCVRGNRRSAAHAQRQHRNGGSSRGVDDGSKTSSTTATTMATPRAVQRGGSGHSSCNTPRRPTSASPQRRPSAAVQPPQSRGSVGSPLRQQQTSIDDLVRFGLHGKRPQRASFESPFRESQPAAAAPLLRVRHTNPHEQQQQHAQPHLFFPAALEELKVVTPQRRGHRVRADAAWSPQSHRHHHRHATPTRALGGASPWQRGHEATGQHHQQQQQPQLFLDAATTAELRSWWDELVLTSSPSHEQSRHCVVQPPLPREAALRAATSLVEAVCGRNVKRHVAKEVALEFNERIHFADFVLMFQRLSSAT